MAAIYLTAAAIVERAGRFLVVEERVRGALTLNQPAGHREAGETFLEAVVRETHEETGGHFVPRSVVGVYLWERADGSVIVRSAFAGDFDGDVTDQPPDPDIIRTLWMTRDELDRRSSALRGPLVLRCVQDFAEGRRLPLDALGSVMTEVVADE